MATGDAASAVLQRAREAGMNLRAFPQRVGGLVGISLDETTTREDITALWQVFAAPGQALPSFKAF